MSSPFEKSAVKTLKASQDTDLRVKSITVSKAEGPFITGEHINITRNGRTNQYIINDVKSAGDKTTLTLHEAVKPSFCTRQAPCEVVLGCRGCDDCFYNSEKKERI